MPEPKNITATTTWLTKTVHPFVRLFLCRYAVHSVLAIESKRTSADYDIYKIELLFSAN